MFILDDERKRTYMAKQCLYYLAASLFLAVFGRIYEHFSHEVYSWYMMYAFLLPLAGGALPALILSLYGRGLFPVLVFSPKIKKKQQVSLLPVFFAQ